jgi:hypothetical protein
MERGVFHTSTIRAIQADPRRLDSRLTPNFLAVFNDSILENQVFSRLFGLARALKNEKNLAVVMSVALLVSDERGVDLARLKEIYKAFRAKFRECDLDRVIDHMDHCAAQPADAGYRLYERPWF